MDDARTFQEIVTDAINQAIADQGDGDFVTKFVAIIEVFDKDGDHALWAVASKDINAWDTLGMLQWGIQHEQSGKILRMIQEMREADDD